MRARSAMSDVKLLLIATVIFIAVIVMAILLFAWRMEASLREPRAKLLEGSKEPRICHLLLEIANRHFDAPSTRMVGMGYHQVPVPLQALGIHSARRINGGDGNADVVAFECGGADNHFGLIVTPTDQMPSTRSIWPVRFRVAEQIWYYDELRDMARGDQGVMGSEVETAVNKDF